MNVHNPKIAQAAIQVISRYGLKKTTMGDLAQAAGVSRQTLYNAYANKDEVIRDAIRFVTAEGISGVRAAWDADGDLGAQIDAFFAFGPLAWYDAIQSTPDAADLIDGMNTAGAAEIAEAEVEWHVALAGVFAPYETRLSELGQSPDTLARFVYLGAHAAKTSAASRDDMVVQLGTLKASVLALAQGT